MLDVQTYVVDADVPFLQDPLELLQLRFNFSKKILEVNLDVIMKEFRMIDTVRNHYLVFLVIKKIDESIFFFKD